MSELVHIDRKELKQNKKQMMSDKNFLLFQ